MKQRIFTKINDVKFLQGQTWCFNIKGDKDIKISNHLLQIRIFIAVYRDDQL